MEERLLSSVQPLSVKTKRQGQETKTKTKEMEVEAEVEVACSDDHSDRRKEGSRPRLEGRGGAHVGHKSQEHGAFM